MRGFTPNPSRLSYGDSFPFAGHLSLAEVAELLALGRNRQASGTIKHGSGARYSDLARRYRPPVYPRRDEPQRVSHDLDS